MNAAASRTAYVAMLAVCAAATVWSLIGVADLAIWIFELSLGGSGIVVLVASRTRFPMSSLTYLWVAFGFVLLAVGAKYTYSLVPLFDWLREPMGWERNHFDRLGHFFQGFVPVLIAREIFLRRGLMRRGWFCRFTLVCFATAFAAFYELLEMWIVMLFYPASGPEWLGMQGDPWDAQMDILMALMGSVTALVTCSRLQDRSIARVAPSDREPSAGPS